MASALSGIRAHLAAVITSTGLAVTDHVPSQITPPLVIIGSADEYITRGDTFDPDALEVALELYAIAGTAENDQALDQLEQMVEQLMVAVAEITKASAPFMASANGSAYLTSRLSLSLDYTLP